VRRARIVAQTGVWDCVPAKNSVRIEIIDVVSLRGEEAGWQPRIIRRFCNQGKKFMNNPG
jgi:hypothetical protein